MPSEVVVREYAHESPEYLAAVQLRREVLRWPLGLEFTREELAGEANEILLGAFTPDGVIVGTLNLMRQGRDFKMRQVAVVPSLQGAGIGSRLVAFCEELARKRGGETIALHAREGAVPFYERLGYEVVGEPFVEVTLPHRKMRKSLIG